MRAIMLLAFLSACATQPVSAPPPQTGDGQRELGAHPLDRPPNEYDPCCSDDPPESCLPPPGECWEFTCGAGFCTPK